MIHLSHQELGILQELAPDEWLSSQELATSLDLAPFHVRSSLQALRRFQLVERGPDRLTVGKFRITPAGRRELASRQQPRMVV